MLRYSPTSEPTTTATSAMKRMFTPRRCPFGSTPPTRGAMKSPAASQDVAIQKSPSCRCHVRVRLYGSHWEGGTEEAISLHTVVRDPCPRQDLDEEERGHDHEVLQGGALGRRRAQADERVASGRGFERRGRGHRRVEPDNETDAAQEQEDAPPGPHEGLGPRNAAGQRLAGTVARVRA